MYQAAAQIHWDTKTSWIPVRETGSAVRTVLLLLRFVRIVGDVELGVALRVELPRPSFRQRDGFARIPEPSDEVSFTLPERK